MEKISVIVPVYNSEKYLDKCLDTLCNQTLREIEIIMVNDGSTDNSENIIKDRVKKDSRIKLYNKKNGGQASARNLGLTKATGEYIAFIDSDDYIELNFCEELYNVAKKNNSDIVCFDYFITKADKDEYNKILNDKKTGTISLQDYIFSGAGPCNKIYRNAFLRKNNFRFPEGIIYEDFASIPALVKHNPSVFYLNKSLFHYVQTSSSTMRNDEYKEKYEDIFKACDILYNELNNSLFFEELEYLICYHMLYLGSLNFYKYEKYEQIDKISDFMKRNFPYWRKNKYLKNKGFKEKLLMKLFYHRKYDIIKLCQSIKR